MPKKPYINGIVGHMLLMLESDATEREIEEFLEKNYQEEKQKVLDELVKVWSSLRRADDQLKHYLHIGASGFG